MKPPVILLLGPTATGKTDLAIEFAKHIPSEIISVDSAMVYRGLNIGTGKPDASELKETKHHLIDIRDPSEPYSAAEFSLDAIHLIEDIRERGKIPLLVGGTMLYFRALLQGLSPLPSANKSVRAQLLKEAETTGWQAMHDRLKTLDPKAALRIHPNDPQRIQRALEIYEITGQAQSELWDSELWGLENNLSNPPNLRKTVFDFSPLHIFVILPEDRALLHDRIAKRFHWMLKQGFMAEVEKLYRDIQAGELSMDLPALRSVGYRQALHYLAGDCTYDEMVNRAIAATRQLAKRQITWLRSLFKFTETALENRKYCKDDGQEQLEQPLKLQKEQIHFLDLQNNHLDSLKSMLHSVS